MHLFSLLGLEELIQQKLGKMKKHFKFLKIERSSWKDEEVLLGEMKKF